MHVTNTLNHPSSRWSKFEISIVLAFMIAICLNTFTYITDFPLTDDARTNLKLSFNLAHHHVISMSDYAEQATLTPSNEREPIPVLLNTLWISAFPSLAEVTNVQQLQSSPHLPLLKSQFVLYTMLTMLGIYLLISVLIKQYVSYYPRVVVSLLVATLVYQCMHVQYVNTLLTDLLAQLWIVWSIYTWLMAVETQQKKYYWLTGLLLGCLVLTKAAFMYIVLASFMVILPWLWLTQRKKTLVASHLLILVVCTVTIMPWFIRNHVQLGVWEHTQRGPIVLLTRAYKNAITDVEFKGAFYAYAPYGLKTTMGQQLGFNEADRAKGGRLQRLTRFPEGDLALREQGNEHDAISYYIKASTHAQNIRRYIDRTAPNATQARLQTDAKVKQEAVSLIKNNLGAHLKATLVFAWRGAWPCNTVDGRWKEGTTGQQPFWQELLPFLGLFTMFGLLLFALLSQHVTGVILSILGVNTFMFYALATHFIPRYSEMFIPIWVIVLAYVAISVATKLLTKIKLATSK